MSSQARGRPAHFVAWLVAEPVVRGAETVVAPAAVALHLAHAGFGTLNFALAVVGLATPLMQLDFGSILVWEPVRFPYITGALLGTSFAPRLAAGSVLAAVLALRMLPGLSARSRPGLVLPLRPMSREFAEERHFNRLANSNP